MRMAEWRLQERLTQKEAAQRCGMDQSSWSMIEGGKRKPTPPTAAKILEGTGGQVKPQDLGLSMSSTDEDALVARVAERVVREVLEQIAVVYGLTPVGKAG